MSPPGSHTERSFRTRVLRNGVLNRLLFFAGAFWVVGMTVLFAIAYGAAHLVTRDPRVFRFWASGWGRAIVAGFGARVNVRRMPEIDPEASYVFVSNHQNGLDIPILAMTLPCPFGYVSKAELETVPFLGRALKMSPSVFVDRRDPERSLESIRRAGKQIREGSSVVVFPEGSRTYGPNMMRFKKSAFVLAAEAGVPVVPVTIVNSYSVLDERRKVARPGRVEVVVHDPVEVPSSERREINRLIERVEETIRSELPRSSVQAQADPA